MIDKSRRGPIPPLGYSSLNHSSPPGVVQPFPQSSGSNLNYYRDVQPIGLMTFKQFTMSQDDHLSPNELLEMYDSYKSNYVQKHRFEFLEDNKTSPFILEKFHPTWIKKIMDEKKKLTLKRIEVFLFKLNKGDFNFINRTVASEKVTKQSTIICNNTLLRNDDVDCITLFGNSTYFEAELRSHIVVLTDIPVYISHLDIIKFFSNDFPLSEGSCGRCQGFLDISLTTPKFNRGILNRQCYILFDSVKNRDQALSIIKGKTIRSLFTTSSILKSFLDINQQSDDSHEQDNCFHQPGMKYSIYIIQAKAFDESNSMRFGNLPKIFSTDERLLIDKKNMIRIIEKLEKDQNIQTSISQLLDSTQEISSTKTTVDILYVYLRFVHGIEYYSFTMPNIFQNISLEQQSSQHKEFSSNIGGTQDSFQENILNGEFCESLKSNEELNRIYNNLLLLSRGYIDTLLRNKFRGGWLREETGQLEIDYEVLLKDPQNQLLIKNLEENMEILLNLPPFSDLIPKTISDEDKLLSSTWKRYCEQHTVRKKTDRWQCGKCLKQFKGEEFVHKHLGKKHRDFLETIREGMTFEKIIKPSADKFPSLIYPANSEELNLNAINKRGCNHNLQGSLKSRFNRHSRTNPYEKKRYYRDWDIPKQTNNGPSNDIRVSIKYDDL
ncbi:Arsenite-resistance protein 2 [Cryptosporidium felis]|nr:Arsenite-resistance protein 2 [Cryptosporidium felis]